MSSIYTQTDDDNHNSLDASSISGLPHKFTISYMASEVPTDITYDLDVVEDIMSFPAITVKFSINGTSYYFDEYFRLCALRYEINGRPDIASALRKKANVIESAIASMNSIDNDRQAVKEFLGALSRDIQNHIDNNDFLQQIIREEEDWRREQRGLSPMEDAIYQMDHMEGHAFEHWCADLLQRYGYEDVEVTPGSNDQGVDVLAQKEGIRYAIQCKCYSSDLGNAPVQEVNVGKAIYHCHVGVVMTNRYFTQGAKDAAAATGTLLWDRDKLIKMIKGM